jgi:uncharacterized protein YggE
MSDEVTKKVMVSVWLVLALSALGYVYQYGRSVKQTYPARSFTVDGEAKMALVPDIATFSVSVVSEGTQVPEIQKMNTEKMNAVQNFLEDLGTDKKDLQTTQYSLNPRYDYHPCDRGVSCPAPSIAGYTLTQELTVKVRDTEKLGEMLSGVTSQGANTVSNVTFSVDDDEEDRNKARTEAIAEAKKKAKDIAKAGGFRVGRLVSIYEDQSNPGQPLYGNRAGGVAVDALKSSAEMAPSIEPGTRESSVRVTLTFEIAG